jgi:hypothetical protein
LKSVSRRIVDRRVLHLIKMWLDCPVEETDDRGRRTRTTEAREAIACVKQNIVLLISSGRIRPAWLADGEERASERKACLSQSGRNLQRELRHESKFLIFFALNPLKRLDSEK